MNRIKLILDTSTCKPKTCTFRKIRITYNSSNINKKKKEKHTLSAEHPKHISEVNKHFTRTHSPISSLLLLIFLFFPLNFTHCPSRFFIAVYSMLLLLLLPPFSVTLPLPPHCYYFKLLWNRKRKKNREKNAHTHTRAYIHSWSRIHSSTHSHSELFHMITENISFRQFLFVFDFFIPLHKLYIEWNYLVFFRLLLFLLLLILFHPSSKWMKMLASFALYDVHVRSWKIFGVYPRNYCMYKFKLHRHVRIKWKRVWMNNKSTHERVMLC